MKDTDTRANVSCNAPQRYATKRWDAGMGSWGGCLV
jgi:hypothetical protein